MLLYSIYNVRYRDAEKRFIDGVFMAEGLSIAQIETDDDVLRRIADPVKNISSEEIQNLIDKLMSTCKKAKGMGIAAPQIFHSKQIFIMSSHPNTRYPNAPLMKPVAVINPEIIRQSEEKEKDWEGCLSVPDLRGLVPRSTTIEVTYSNRLGEHVSTRYHGFLSRLFQHEYDHLKGILFIDKVLSKADIILEKEYQDRAKKNNI